MVKCDKCGFDNPPGSSFCNKCGNPVSEPQPAPAQAEPIIKPNVEVKDASKPVTIFCVVATLAIVVIVAFMLPSILNNDPDDDNQRKDLVNAVPLNGTYTLTGSTELDDGTEYYTTSVFTFNKGSMVNCNVKTTINEPSAPSGIDLNRHTVSINGGEVPNIPDGTTMPGYVSTDESIADHNPFLSGMTGGHCKTLTTSNGSKSVHGFSDSRGNIYYLSVGGELVGYEYHSDGVRLLAILSDWSA